MIDAQADEWNARWQAAIVQLHETNRVWSISLPLNFSGQLPSSGAEAADYHSGGPSGHGAAAAGGPTSEPSLSNSNDSTPNASNTSNNSSSSASSSESSTSSSSWGMVPLTSDVKQTPDYWSVAVRWLYDKAENLGDYEEENREADAVRDLDPQPNDFVGFFTDLPYSDTFIVTAKIPGVMDAFEGTTELLKEARRRGLLNQWELYGTFGVDEKYSEPGILDHVHTRALEEAWGKSEYEHRKQQKAEHKRRQRAGDEL